jgi:tRNA 2-thiocytidine biosynthesis protein TtcA
MSEITSKTCPPWTETGKEIESLIRKAIFDFDLISTSEKNIAIALSGGKDSLSLLFFLNSLRNRGFSNFNLHAIHIAGEFTCGAGVDGDYLKAICKDLNIPFIVRSSTQKLETLQCYKCSRERRKLIFEAAKEVNACTIAFGHHRDDNAQTLLLNLLTKGEFAGNLPKVPMIDYGVTIIRPLIYVPEEKIKTFAQQYGFARITCQCPVGQKSNRKNVEELIKIIERKFPCARSNLASSSLKYGSRKALKP